VIYYRNHSPRSGLNARRIKHVARTLLHEVGEGASTLAITFVNDREIRRLNREHRGKDKATDVLSFPLYERGERAYAGESERMLGDIVISVDTARRQAAEYDAPLENEVHRLLIHGILHVLGHDHERSDERAAMEAEERRLAAAIGMPWPYD
jgi:probable rRNA maturation factor